MLELDFSSKPDLFCEVVLALESEVDAAARLEGLFDSGQWRRATEPWATCLFNLGERAKAPDGPAAVLQRRVLRSFVEREHLTDDDVAQAVGLLARGSGTGAVRRELVAWLVRESQPNDAALVADVLDWHVPRDEELQADWRPLGRWLIEKGSSELKSAHRQALVVRLTEAYGPAAEPHELAVLVRLLAYNPRPTTDDGWGQQVVTVLARSLERLLHEFDGESVVGDALDALPGLRAPLMRTAFGGIPVFERHQPVDRAPVPRLRSALARRLADGRLSVPADDPELWRALFVGPAEDLHVQNEELGRALIDKWWSSRIGTENEADPEGWGRVLSRELLRTADVLRRRAPSDLLALRRAVIDARRAKGVIASLRQAVAPCDDAALGLAKAILDEPNTHSGVLSPALKALEAAPAIDEPPAKNEVDLDPLLEAISAVVGRCRDVVCGFDLQATAQGATRVAADDLPDERAFIVRGDAVVVSRGALRRLHETFEGDASRQHAIAALYAVHEMVHDFQGIAGKGEVARVRFAGAESALMHIDLGADHVAALVVHRAFPEWSLDWLKDVQGLSLRGFPADKRNPPFSRLRKTLRLVGLRADLLMRREGIGQDVMRDESYGFADFAPGGGPVAFLVNRPPFVVVRVGSLTPTDARVLFDAVEGTESRISSVDNVLRRALNVVG